MKNLKITLILITLLNIVSAQENSISPIFSLSEYNSNGFLNTINSLNQLTGASTDIESFSSESFIGNNFAVSTLESSNVDKLFILNSNNNLAVYDIPYFFDLEYSGFQNEINLSNNITDLDYHHQSSVFYAFDIVSDNLYTLSLNNADLLSTINIPFTTNAANFNIKTTNDYVILSGIDNDIAKIGFYEILTDTYSELELDTPYIKFCIVSNYNIAVVYAIATDINNVNYLLKINPTTKNIDEISELPSCQNCLTESFNYDKNGFAINWENNELLAIVNKQTSSDNNYFLMTFDLNSGNIKYVSILENKTSNLYFNKASADLVFPGDTNHDGVVDMKDLFSIGLKYSFNTNERFTKTIDWIGQHSFNTGVVRQGVDVKHADCNGDGQINSLDIEAIKQNYSYIHNSNKSLDEINGICDYPLAFSTSILHADGTAEINIKLGDVSDIVYDVYSLSFTVSYDTNFVVDNSMHTDGSLSTWFGTYGGNASQLGIDDYTNGKIDIAISGLDLLNRSGGGDIITLAWTMEDEVMPIANPFVDMNLKIDNITVLNFEEEELDGCGVDTVIAVYKEIVSIKKIDKTKISIFPNPANNIINITSHIDINYIELASMQGKNVQTFENTSSLDVSNISKGIYFLKLYTKEGIYIDKIIIE